MKKTELDVILEDIYKDDYYYLEENIFQKAYTAFKDKMQGTFKNFIENFSSNPILKLISEKKSITDKLKTAQRFLDNAPFIKKLGIKLNQAELTALATAIKTKNMAQQAAELDKLASNLIETGNLGGVVEQIEKTIRLNNSYLISEADVDVMDFGTEEEMVPEEKKGYVKYIIMLVLAAIVGISVSSYLLTHSNKKTPAPQNPGKGKAQPTLKKSDINKFSTDDFYNSYNKKDPNGKNPFADFLNDNASTMKSVLSKLDISETENPDLALTLLKNNVKEKDFSAKYKTYLKNKVNTMYSSGDIDQETYDNFHDDKSTTDRINNDLRKGIKKSVANKNMTVKEGEDLNNMFINEGLVKDYNNLYVKAAQISKATGNPIDTCLKSLIYISVNAN